VVQKPALYEVLSTKLRQVNLACAKMSCADRDSSEATAASGGAPGYEGRGHAEMQPFDYAAARAQAPGLELGLNGAGSGGGRRGRGRGRGGRDSGGRGRGRGERP